MCGRFAGTSVASLSHCGSFARKTKVFRSGGLASDH